MFDNLVDKLGEWNPQLFRELKGRLTARNLAIAALVSATLQVFTVGTFSNQYCGVPIDVGLGGCKQYYTEIYWDSAFTTFNIILPLLLFAGGVYVLATDLLKEQRQGTLYFVRLSPRSSQSILLGKLLGVPAILYAIVGLAFPLHFISAIAAGASLGWFFGFYLVVAAGCTFLYVASTLNALLTQVQYQAIASSIIAAWFGGSYISLILFQFNWKKQSIGAMNWQWFSWDVAHSPQVGFPWLIITTSVLSYWSWQALNRRFSNPHGTLLNKKQSYWIVGSVQIWLLGFFHPFIETTQTSDLVGMMFGMSMLNLPLFLLLISTLIPERQSLLDWARYAHEIRRKNSKWGDWIWGEKSPATVAIAIELGIVGAIWGSWVLLWQVDIGVKLQALVGLLLTLNLIWIYGAIAQCVMFWKLPQQRISATGIALSAIALPPLGLAILLDGGYKFMELWMMSVFGASWIALHEASAIAIGLSFLGQIAAIAALNLTLKRQISHAGASASKSLLTEA